MNNWLKNDCPSLPMVSSTRHKGIFLNKSCISVLNGKKKSHFTLRNDPRPPKITSFYTMTPYWNHKSCVITTKHTFLVRSGTFQHVLKGRADSNEIWGRDIKIAGHVCIAFPQISPIMHKTPNFVKLARSRNIPHTKNHIFQLFESLGRIAAKDIKIQELLEKLDNLK